MRKQGRGKRRATPASVVIPEGCKRSIERIEEDIIVVALGMAVWYRTRLGETVEIKMSADRESQSG